MEIAGQSVGVGDTLENGVLRLQGPGVYLAARLQRGGSENTAAAVDFRSNVVILVPGKHVLRVCPIGPRSLIERGIGRERLGASQPSATDLGDPRLDGCRHPVLCPAQRLESDVAHDVSDVRPWVKEHRHIPPGVPLILPFGGHLVSHVLIDFVQHLVPARLGGLLVELLNQRRVNGDIQILVVFLDGLFELAHHALGGVELVTGSQLAQDGGRLYRLPGGGLHLRVEGKQLRRGLPVSRVGGVDKELLAQGSDVFGHDALAYLGRKLLQRPLIALLLNRPHRPVSGSQVAPAVIGQLPAQHHVLDVPHHLVRDGFCTHGGGGGLADAAALRICGRHVHRTGRVGPFGEELAPGALELRPWVEALPRRACLKGRPRPLPGRILCFTAIALL